MDLTQLQHLLKNQQEAPVDLWSPSDCGEMDLTIKRDGSWWYMGSIIHRKPLVKLFSRVIKKEQHQYYLITPVEKIKIKVEDVPFRIVAVEKVADGHGQQQYIVMRTNVDDIVKLDAAHPLEISSDKQGNPLPFITVRKNLQAKLTTAVFYEIVAMAETCLVNGVQHLRLKSGALWFDLGATE